MGVDRLCIVEGVIDESKRERDMTINQNTYNELIGSEENVAQ